MKQDIYWHEEELEKLEKQLEQLEDDVSFYETQIYMTHMQGKDSFDRNLFMKNKR